MSLDDGQDDVVDLTAESDSDDYYKRYTVPKASSSCPRFNVSLPASTTHSHSAPTTQPYQPHQNLASNAPPIYPGNIWHGTDATGPGYSNTTDRHYVPVSHNGTGDLGGPGQAEKRRKVSPTDEPWSGMSQTPMQAQSTRPPLIYNKQSHNQNGPPPQINQFFGGPIPRREHTPSYFAGPAKSRAYEEQDNILPDVSHTTDEPPRSWGPATKPGDGSWQASSAAKTIKKSRPFSEEEEHLIIFLKEVKKMTWKEITAEFNKCYPGWQYHTIQSRYSTKINQRDRSLDPVQLKLPPRWAAEAVIDWALVHAENPGPRERFELPALPREIPRVSQAPTRYKITGHALEEDYSSGNEFGTRQQRPRRAPPVNYDVRRRNRQLHQGFEDDAFDEVGLEQVRIGNDPIRSATPEYFDRVPVNTTTVTNEPINMTFVEHDAGLTLGRESLPYISSAQRLVLQEPHHEWQWDPSSRVYQGAVVHVDFGAAEWSVVEKLAFKFVKSGRATHHTTKRRHFRAVLRDLTEPQIKSLAHELRKQLPLRSRDSIQAFLQDAIAGKISATPRVLRFAAARKAQDMSSTSKQSYTSLLRQRELGAQSRRGWRAASTAVPYQVKNKVMDSLGPLYSWTGASSDIHTVAWSPDGQTFAAGAVAVTDPDSMQYNRPNNLLFGRLADNTIHELAEHSIKREKTVRGVNSTHAMFVSQDPQLYTSVTAVAFSPSGKVMYTGGYDNRLMVWHLNPVTSQPVLGQRFLHKAEVDMLAVNSQFAGIVATAARRATDSAIKLIILNEDKPDEFTRTDFCSERALSRPELQIFPQALQFEPQYGRLLLAGFGPSVKDKEDDSFIATGDLCLWDVETTTPLQIHGSSRNVFDIAFNPNRRSMPLFAVGCVAAGNVNRRTRSVVRLYDERLDKYTCPLEVECTALDMNDVVWCPHDEYLIAAGCTDGCVYVWDIRQPDDPLRTLPHGESLMPLEDGVPHEKSDTGVRFLSWGENTTRLYSGSSDGVVRLWDVTRSAEDTFVKDVIKVNSGIMAGSFSPDFSKLVTGEVNGTINVLEIGRDDYTINDAATLHYVPYALDREEDEMNTAYQAAAESGVAEGRRLVQTQQLQAVPMGNFPVRQMVQGPAYQGPFDSNIDAPFLREQALQFQLSMATTPGTQCDLSVCKNSITKITIEETGDSNRSTDRIPDELRRQWKAIHSQTPTMTPGKAKCTYCSRPARPSTVDDSVLCERCAFACFRCGATNPIAPSTTTLICDSCVGVWDIESLGYECIEQPVLRGQGLNVPPLRRFGRDALEERIGENDASFGDEVNALTEYYFSLGI